METTERERRSKESLKKVLSGIKGLPTLPETFVKLNAMINSPSTTAKQVAQLISSDPAIAAKTLRIVNSPFYGFPRRISTITHAIVILGFSTLRSIVLGSSVLRAFGSRSRSAQFSRIHFWNHSIGCGVAAKVIAKRIGMAQLEEYFIAGLLHDVGKIVIDQHLHDEFLQILDIVAEKGGLIRDAEEEVLGIDHAELGAHLFEEWKFPKMIVRAVNRHHSPHLAGDYIQQASILHLADILARALMIGNGGDRSIPRISPKAWKELGLTANDLTDIMDEIGSENEKARIFMDFVT